MPPSPPLSPWLLHGYQALERGDSGAAERHFRQALLLRQGEPHALQGLALALIRQHRRAEARPVLEQAAAALPKDAGCAANLGALLIELGDPAAAESPLRRATRLDPEFAPAWNNLGRALMHLDRLDEAETVLRRALTRAPTYGECRQNWRDTQDVRLHRLEEQGRYRTAVDEATKALAVDPDWPRLRYFRACNLLRLGRFDLGWTDYVVEYDDVVRFDLPRWQGEALPPGDRLMVRAEQGIGEQVMLARLLAAAQARAPEVVLECDRRLVPLFARSFPTVTCVGWTAPPDPALGDSRIRRQIPLGRLSRLFLPDFAAFGDGAAYLTADCAQVAQRRRVYGADKPVIGLSWHSGRSPIAQRKAVPLAALRPLLTGLNARFLVLQYEPPAEDIAEMRGWGLDLIEDPSLDPMTELDGFAAAIRACDHVLTISNATAHFAGALGVPASVLLGTLPLWHWFVDRADSPWYASLRLYHRRHGEEWDAVVDRVTAELARRP